MPKDPMKTERKDKTVTKHGLLAPTVALLCALTALVIPGASAQPGLAPLGSDAVLTLPMEAPGWKQGEGISFGSQSFSGTVTNQNTGVSYTCAADGDALSLATPMITEGTMKPARQVTTMKVSGYTPKGVTPRRGEVTDPAKLAQIAYIAAMPGEAPKGESSAVEAAAREAAIARVAGVYRDSVWDLAARDKLTLANGSELKPAADRSVRIRDEAEKLAGPYDVGISLKLEEGGQTGRIEGVGIVSNAGTWMADKTFDIVLDGPAEFASGGQKYSGRTGKEPLDALQFVVTGRGEISATLTVRDVPDALPWISEGESNAGRAQSLIELGRLTTVEATASIVVQWQPVITSQASLEVGPDNAGIRDVITVSGLPDEHDESSGDAEQDSDEAIMDHYLYFIPSGTEHVEGVTQQLEPIAQAQTPARNGEYVIESTDLPIDWNLGMGTYQVVSEFVGDELVASIRTSDVEESEQVTPVFGNVKTRAFSPDGDLHPGGSIADTVILDGVFPAGAYTEVDLFSWGNGEPALCEEPVWTAPRIEHGNQNGEFDTATFVTPGDVEATYGFVERTHDHLGNLISQGECGAESETLRADVPVEEVPESAEPSASATVLPSPESESQESEAPAASSPPEAPPTRQAPDEQPWAGQQSASQQPHDQSAKPAPSGKELPRTGAVSDLLIPLGLGLVAAGAGAVFVVMRRR